MSDNTYNPKDIEQKWQKRWIEERANETPENPEEGKKKYILDMFPYPSGAGLHVGHAESYTATDIYSRYLRMNGFDVLHPQGFDAFGLPAENYAIKTGIHPAVTTQKAIETFKKQIDSMGFSYDWEREVISSDPEYYKWTQWLFLELYKNGLAYKKKAKVNWCPKCQTVLANEQAEGGKCERCESAVVQKDLEQWFFKITDFIEDSDVGMGVGMDIPMAGLLSGLEKVDWPNSTKLLQENWIGKSVGVQFKMNIETTPASGHPSLDKEGRGEVDNFIEVFTTRIDTIFGMTYAVVAPEHEILKKVQDDIQNWKEVEKYVEKSKSKTDVERMEAKEKTGVKIKGVKVINPMSGEEVPLYVADYVLSHYGTGAVMAVPAHDARDFEFAKKNEIAINYVITPAMEYEEYENYGQTFTRIGIENEKEERLLTEQLTKEDKPQILYGYLINSDKYTGLHSEEAKEKMADWLEKEGLGTRKVNYKLRDWLVSRQRYWGAPIPIIYCDECASTGSAQDGMVPVPEKDLPVELPDDVDFKPTGESPLKYSKKFQNIKCPKCGSSAKRESDTMDTFVCSSWYYLRYSDPKNYKQFASKENLKKWLPVDLYVGGAEHSVLHLLYSRFFTKVLHKLGYLEFDEPFLKLRHQGTILAEDGTKMSKSKGNVVNPDEVVEKYGADSLRMYEMFMGPLEDAKPWNTKGIIGVYRFLERVYKLNSKLQDSNPKQITNDRIQNLIHKTIRKVSGDIEDLKFNTANQIFVRLKICFYFFAIQFLFDKICDILFFLIRHFIS